MRRTIVVLNGCFIFSPHGISYKNVSVSPHLVKRFHHVTITVFGRHGEDPLTPLNVVSPVPPGRLLAEGEKSWVEKGHCRYSLMKDKARLDVQQTMGFDSEITVYALRYEKDAHSNAIFDGILAGIDDGQRSELYRKAMLHVDDEGHFFIRLDKPDLENGKLTITTRGDCYKFDFALAVFPKNPQTIHAHVRGLLEK
jgi:RNA binding exosome subunit